METVIVGMIATTIAAGTVMVLAAMGELLAEQAGVLNLGVEGMMALGAAIGIIMGNQFGNAWVGLTAAMLAAMLLALLFAVATVTFKANQILAGLALTFLGVGLAGRIGAPFAGQPAIDRFEPVRLPFLADIPIVGEALFNHNILVYLSYLALPLVVHFVLYHTRHGLNVRAVGENPAAADAVGTSVDMARFFYVLVGGALAGAGGAYLTLAFTPAWSEGVVGGRGWIAIALVIFAGWRPFLVVLGALLFGGMTSLGFVAQAQGWGIAPAFLSMLPYLATFALMLVPVILGGRAGRRFSTAPAALGTPFFRDGR